VNAVELSEVKRRVAGWLVSELGRGLLRFRRCELLLLETSS
jgi:hypothetical protein